MYKITVLVSSKVRGVAESLVITKDDFRGLRGQKGMKQFKNVGLKTKSSLGLNCC